MQINLIDTTFLGKPAYIKWGRNATINGQRGEGGAMVYMGEAYEVMKLLCGETKSNPLGKSQKGKGSKNMATPEQIKAAMQAWKEKQR